MSEHHRVCMYVYIYIYIYIYIYRIWCSFHVCIRSSGLFQVSLLLLLLHVLLLLLSFLIVC